MNDEYKEFLSIKEVAKYLGVYRDTVYRYIRDIKKPLPAMKISRKKILVKKIDLDSWLENHKKTKEVKVNVNRRE
jgi:excisionase family DNA binding protein